MSKAKPKRRAAVMPLSRERILQTALQLADRGGLDSISMRKLAQALGVEAMSLYNHVSSKDDVLDGIADLVVSEIEVPEIGGDWRLALRKRAISAHTVLRSHPWSPLLIASRVNVGPAMLRYINATLGCLREAGFSYELADRAWNALDSHIYGFTLLELNFPLDPSEYVSAATQFIPLLPQERFPYMRELTQRVIDGKHHGLQQFEFGLDLLLAGLETLRNQEL
ncbi:MAG TPA: TetR/AcrR family transcriptional regulator [Polyangiales bacterium]|jgi:AcrR family transcriptional regulator|nr:TetR/AcrR family transcriptional regulator [Polyangiales bacterium]